MSWQRSIIKEVNNWGLLLWDQFISSSFNFLLVPFKQDWNLICLWQLSTRLNFFWQKGHWNGCSPVCERICDSIWCLLSLTWLQHGHAYCSEPVSDCIGIGAIWKNKYMKIYQFYEISKKKQNGWTSSRDIPIKSETGSRQYECSCCNHVKDKRHHMESHIRSHTGEEPFQRPFCKKKKIHVFLNHIFITYLTIKEGFQV